MISNVITNIRLFNAFIIKFNGMTTHNQKQGTIKILSHESEILKNNPLGDKFIRDVIVYLPPGYDGIQKFPTVYCLTGFTGRGKMFLNDSAFTPNLAERICGNRICICVQYERCKRNLKIRWQIGNVETPVQR